MRHPIVAAAVALLAFLTMLLPSYGHGDGDVEFTGPFAAQTALINPSSLAQSFTPEQSTLVALDLFLTTDGQLVNSEVTLTVHVRENTLGGVWGAVLGTASITVPSGTNSTAFSPYVTHVDLSPAITLTPETRYIIQVETADSYFWATNSGNLYTKGNAFIGTNLIDLYDFGFRTYYGPAAVPDTTPPKVTIMPDRPSDSDPWYNSPVTFTATGNDEEGGSGVAFCDDPATYSGPDSETAWVTMECLDHASNAGLSTFNFQYDATPPEVLAIPAPAPNDAGWNKTQVTITFDGNDLLSQGVTCDNPVTLSDEGISQSAIGNCSDAAGNTASATASNINIDTTPPTVTITPDRAPDIDGAYDHAVRFTASGDDGEAGSDVASCDQDEVYGGPISGTASVTMKCTDVADNVGLKTFEFQYVDSSPPVVNFTFTPTLPVGGWYTSDATLTWSVVEDESPESLVTAGCVDQLIAEDRPYATYTCEASSAGGAASVVEVAFGRDATKPIITSSLSGIEGSNGWYTSDVVVDFACTDTGSGIATNTVTDVTLTTDGAGKSVTSTGVCSDTAGNTANAVTVAGINIDKTGPTVMLSITGGTVGLNGWYTSDVTVHTSGTDDVSGPVTCTADQLQTSDTDGQTFNGSCTNSAGLTTDADQVSVKMDKTAPSLVPELSAEEIELNAGVTASANASDATSGIASSSCGEVDTGTVGMHTVTCAATDRAGNTSSKEIEYEVMAIAGTIVFGNKPPAGGGYGTFSFGGGTLPQLLSATGCPETTSVFFYNKTDGAFAVWIPGSQVAAVNEEFLAIFASTPPLPEGVIFTGRCV